MSGVKLCFMLEFFLKFPCLFGLLFMTYWVIREIQFKSNISIIVRVGWLVPIRFLISVDFSIEWLFHFFDYIKIIDFRYFQVKSNNSKTGRLGGWFPIRFLISFEFSIEWLSWFFESILQRTERHLKYNTSIFRNQAKYLIKM